MSENLKTPRYISALLLLIVILVVVIGIVAPYLISHHDQVVVRDVNKRQLRLIVLDGIVINVVVVNPLNDVDSTTDSILDITS